MKLIVRFFGLALLFLCGGCAVEGGYGGAYGGVYDEYPSSYYGAARSPVYTYPYPAYRVGPYDRDHYWDRRRHWEQHRWHGDEHWGY